MSHPTFIKSEHVQKISEGEAKFILDHAEKLLKEILQAGDLIISRTITILTLTSGLMIGLVGFVVNRVTEKNCFDSFAIAAIVSVVYLLFPGYRLAKLLLPTEYPVLGAQPISFFTFQFFDDQVAATDRLKYIYLNEIHNYQDRVMYQNRCYALKVSRINSFKR